MAAQPCTMINFIFIMRHKKLFGVEKKVWKISFQIPTIISNFGLLTKNSGNPIPSQPQLSIFWFLKNKECALNVMD